MRPYFRAGSGLAIIKLWWFFYAKRSLRLEELLEALSIKKGELEGVDLWSPDDVVRVMGSFINLDPRDNTIRFRSILDASPIT